MSYFKIYNCYPSFIDTFDLPSGQNVTNPVPNYGGVGDHLEDYFVNRMAETPSGGTENLVAFLASQKSLTAIAAADLTGMANNLSVNYGISGSSVGYGLLDFRGDSWKHLIGDGIIGPSDIGNNTAYTSTKTAAISILSHFSKAYPSIKWAFAGLPHLPNYTTFAPPNGSYFAWNPSLVNNAGATNNHWDASHPTGASYGYKDTIFDWAHSPKELRNFYESNCLSRVQGILDASGWCCPDINPTTSTNYEFGSLLNSVRFHALHTISVVSLAKQYKETQNREFLIQPIINSMLRSRSPHHFDDLSGSFMESGFAQGVSGQILNVKYGFTGASSASCDNDITLTTLRSGVFEPAAFAGVDGFVYQDNIPLMIELACTGATPASAQAQEAVARARNYIAKRVYGSNDTAILPWSTLQLELKSHFSQNITAPQLRVISESVPVGDYLWRSLYAGGVVKDFNGVSNAFDQYQSVYWNSSAPQDPNSQAFVPANCCSPSPTGACCLNGSCVDGVVQSACSGTWYDGLNCDELTAQTGCVALVDCCINGVCQSGVPVTTCQSSGGTVLPQGCAAAQSACACNTQTNCICVRTATDTNCSPTKYCRKYELLNPCCCINAEGDPTIPAACGPIGTALKCNIANNCPPPCESVVTVSPELQACCNFSCSSSVHGNSPLGGPCLFFPCPTNYSDCVPVSNFLADPNNSNQLKQLVVNDMSSLFGITIEYPVIPTDYTVDHQFRSSGSLVSTLSAVENNSVNPWVSYISLLKNYDPSASTISRIQSEFAFDRLLIPISYT